MRQDTGAPVASLEWWKNRGHIACEATECHTSEWGAAGKHKGMERTSDGTNEVPRAKVEECTHSDDGHLINTRALCMCCCLLIKTGLRVQVCTQYT